MNSKPKSIRNRWGSMSFVGAMALLMAGGAHSQASVSADDNVAELEEITVTGSRIVRSGFSTPSPVVSIGAADIQQQTTPALGDMLNDLPQLRTTFGLSNSSRFIGTAGVGLLDLRGIGTDRTLVLVNGRRHVSSSAGNQGVDVNSIPTDMVERVEIITGANSAVYGADAVAGVVNFILKDDFEGFSVRSSTGKAGDSDFGRNSFAVTMGNDFSDGRGNAIFSLGFDDQDLLTAGERGGEFVALWDTIANPEDGDTIDANGIQVDDGIPDDITVPNEGFWGISTAGTSLALNGRMNPDGSFSPVPFDEFQYQDGLVCAGTGCTPLDTSSFQVLQAEFQRVTLDANFTYDLAENLTGYFESRYALVETAQQGQPTFDFGAPIIIQRDNAFVSPSLAAAMDSAGLSAIDLRRFNIDLGNRKENNNRQTIRLVAGVKGDVSEDVRFDVSANYGRSTVERINLANRIDERWLAATDAVAIDAAGAAALVASGLNPAAQAGDIVCRATLNEALGTDSGLPDWAYEGCVPANVLGFGLISDEAIEFVNSTALSHAEIQQFQLQATLSDQELFSTWAGPVAGVAGVEYREEKSEIRADSLSALGNTFFNALADETGEFDVVELFVETSVPLLTDAPLAQDLTLEAAARYSDYSTIGETFTWESRISWRPHESLRFRVNHGEALRAPNISDLFAPESENFRVIDDPCDMNNLDVGANGRNVRIANCQALGIADPTTFDSQDESSIRLADGGNSELSEETATTTTVGLIYEPGWLDGLQVSVDWYDIEIEDAISFTTAQSILDKCVDDVNGINNQFCALVTRDSVGNITLLNRFPLNLNEFQTSGMDFEIAYPVELGSWGVLDNRLLASYLDERVEILSSEDNIDIIDGELGDPKWQLNYKGNLVVGDAWDFSLEARWIDSMYLFEQELLFGSATNNDPNPDVADIIETGSHLYLDLGFNYTFDNELKIGLKIDNVTDQDPARTVLGNGGSSGIYDSIGRFFAVRASWEF
ncbi:MAG: TonB-dependent receptor [Woeseiaceae bacterium]|nr:TonB-dependent receptor [Woeseiaceae bacterium]